MYINRHVLVVRALKTSCGIDLSLLLISSRGISSRGIWSSDICGGIFVSSAGKPGPQTNWLAIGVAYEQSTPWQEWIISGCMVLIVI